MGTGGVQAALGGPVELRQGLDGWRGANTCDPASAEGDPAADQRDGASEAGDTLTEDSHDGEGFGKSIRFVICRILEVGHSRYWIWTSTKIQWRIISTAKDQLDIHINIISTKQFGKLFM